MERINILIIKLIQKVKKTGPYGSNGNFVFTVKGRSGMGVHSGRKGPASKTLGCIRTTNKATKYLLELHKTDALTSIKVK